MDQPKTPSKNLRLKHEMDATETKKLHQKTREVGYYLSLRKGISEKRVEYLHRKHLLEKETFYSIFYPLLSTRRLRVVMTANEAEFEYARICALVVKRNAWLLQLTWVTTCILFLCRTWACCALRAEVQGTGGMVRGVWLRTPDGTERPQNTDDLGNAKQPYFVHETIMRPTHYRVVQDLLTTLQLTLNKTSEKSSLTTRNIYVCLELFMRVSMVSTEREVVWKKKRINYQLELL